MRATDLTVGEKEMIQGAGSCLDVETRLGISEFSQLLGVSIPDMTADVCALLDSYDFRYVPLNQSQTESVILKIQKKLNSKVFTPVGPARYDVWNTTWKKISQQFLNNTWSIRSLTPDFLDAHPVLRLNNEFIHPLDVAFEANFFSVLRHWLYRTCFEQVPTLYEFGCGSGFNLWALADMYPDKTLYGLDWAESSVALINKIGEVKGLKIHGRHFDFFHPDPHLHLAPGSGVLTVCALEQVGEAFLPFIQYVLTHDPQLCVHIEPIYELYDERDPLDSLAMTYHADRGYLRGFLPYLRQLEVDRQIQIVQVKRVGFGSLYHEGYTIVIWKPL